MQTNKLTKFDEDRINLFDIESVNPNFGKFKGHYRSAWAENGREIPTVILLEDIFLNIFTDKYFNIYKQKFTKQIPKTQMCSTANI